MLGSGASEGVAEVDRSLGERKTATVVGGWRNGGWFETWSYDDGGLAQERKRLQLHRDFLKTRENRGEDYEE